MGRAERSGSCRPLVRCALVVGLGAAAWCCTFERVSAVPPALPGAGCSALSVTAEGHAVFGANLDYREHCRGQLFVNPRGVHKVGTVPATTGAVARWVSKYASVTFNFVGYQYAWGGMNEAGLAMSTMALPQTVNPPPDHRPGVDSGLWMQFMLDRCGSVDEVIAAEAVVRNITVDHYLVADRTGASATLEWVGGRLVVHRGDQLPVSVLTNWFYDGSLEVWEAHRERGSYGRLDGSLQRFCIAADRVSAFEPAAVEPAVAFVFDTLDAIAGERFSEHASQWSLVFETGSRRAYFRTLDNREIRSVQLQDFFPYCDRPVQMLDIHEPLAGDVGPFFAEYSHERVLDHLLWFVGFWETGLSRAGALALIDHFESFSCDPGRPHRRTAGRRSAGR